MAGVGGGQKMKRKTYPQFAYSKANAYIGFAVMILSTMEMFRIKDDIYIIPFGIGISLGLYGTMALLAYRHKE